MKRTILSLIVGIIALGANAKNYNEDILPSDRNHWTITASYDVSIPGKWKLDGGSFKMFKAGSGISIGADYTMLFGRNFFFEPGARLYYDTYRYDNITINGSDSPYEPSKTMDPLVRKTGLRIPLMFGYNFDIFKKGSLYLSTGPEVTFGFSARTKIDGEEEYEIFEENMYKSMMNRYDIAWDIRAAVIINRFRVDVTGAFGMLDMIKTDVKMHENRVSIGLGYIF